MRRLFVLLILIALLPLRSWAGDAMAIQMAAQAHGSRMAAPAEHANCHEMQADAMRAAQDKPAPDSCATCAFCQACFTIAIALLTLSAGAQALPHGLPLAGSVQFTSATLALSHKPPIS